ncbi:MAG: hypothetical protein LBP72_03225 [Dysgonamonadaceae bacterium]|nr:hypothetical protein [Dysgonamonadaceae bacterium]
MKKTVILFFLLCGALAAQAAGPYYVGLNQLDALLKTIEEPVLDKNDPPQVLELPDYTKNDNADNDGKKWGQIGGVSWSGEVTGAELNYWNASGSKYYALTSIDWSSATYSYTQKSDAEIVLEQPSQALFDNAANEADRNFLERNELRYLETLNLSGNQFRSISINGSDLMILSSVNLSDNPTLEHLSITGCPNLTSVDISNSRLSFAVVAGILANTPAGTLVYQHQGAVAEPFPVDAVDVTALLTEAGTTVASWSETPVSSAGNVYVFDPSLVGQSVTCNLENSNYPDVTLSYTIDLIASNAVILTIVAEHGSIIVEPAKPVIGDEVTITVTADPLYDLVSFSIDGEDKTADLVDNQYTLPLEKLTYTLTAQFSGFDGVGTGVSSDPYIITTEKQLNQIRNDLSAYYQLGNDLVLTDEWEPVRTFTGTLDGNGKVISGLWINLPETGGAGLFGSVTGNATITGLGVIIDPEKSVTGQSCVGAIVGDIASGAGAVTISNSFVCGAVISVKNTGGGESGKNTGGVVGRINGGTPVITNCYAVGSVQGDDRTGGIVGQVAPGVITTISKCYAINSIDGGTYSAGGIVGSGEVGNQLTIVDCAAINPSLDNEDGNSDYNGRICGYAGSGLTLTNNFAYAGMLVKGTTVTGDPLADKHGLSKTAAELINRQTYETGLSWDFDDVWSMGNGEYPLPVLKNIAASAQPATNLNYLDIGTAIKQTPASSISVYSRNGVLYANSSSELIRQIHVYNAQGQLIYADSHIQASSYEVKAIARSAIYLVKLVTDRVETVKVFNK